MIGLVTVLILVGVQVGCIMAANDCFDVVNNCVAYGVDICNGTYHAWAAQNCKNYCGFCVSSIAVPTIGPPAPTPGTCKDRLGNCNQYGRVACTGSYITWARQNCAKYCGFCNDQMVSSLLGNNTCEYKGKHYHQHEVWHDGCEKTCRCIAASTGLYRCTPRCQNITNVPQGCTPFKPDGECCMKIRCTDLSQALQLLGSNATLPPGSGLNRCYYKGNLYQTGDTWEEGCQYRCTCRDASKGLYMCSDRCFTWSLPPECHLEAPPQGKCCSVPRCPAGYVINYPPNYVAD